MDLLSMLTQMLVGSVTTVRLFLMTMLFSIPFGLCLTLLYVSKNQAVRRATGLYILIMRGTPLLLQMFFIYFGAPFLPVIGPFFSGLNRFDACVVAFVLNYAAYFAEIFRGGLLAVDVGQYEASKVLGIGRVPTFFKIVMPQMFRIALPATSNEAMILVKDTALITALGVSELLHVTRNAVNVTASVMPFAIAAVFYLAMSWVVTLFFRQLEKRFDFL